MTRLWLDDLRLAPTGWVLATTASAAIDLLAAGGVHDISLDHDLGPPEAGNGYQVACWIEAQAASGALPRLEWHIHTANPVGHAQMRAALKGAERAWEAIEDAHWARVGPSERFVAGMKITMDVLA